MSVCDIHQTINDKLEEILKRRPELKEINYDRDNPVDMLLITRYHEYMTEIENINGWCIDYWELDTYIKDKRDRLHNLACEHGKLYNLVGLFVEMTEEILKQHCIKLCCVVQ